MNREQEETRRSLQALTFSLAIAALMVLALCSMGCAAIDQKPGPVSQQFNQVAAPVPIRCIDPKDVPAYPTLTPLVAGATHKQVDAANEADLESFRLYAEAARPLLVQCSKGITP